MQKSIVQNIKSNGIDNFLLYSVPVIILVNNIFFNSGTFINEAVIILCTIIAIISNIKNGYISKVFIISSIAVFFAGVSSFVNGSGLGSLATYANLIFFLLVYSNKNLNKREMKIFFLMIIISLIVVVGIFSDQNSINKYYYSIVPGITANYINPNTMGMILFYLYIYLVILIYLLCNEKFMFILQSVLFILFFVLIKQTEARTTLLAMIIFFLFLLFKKKVNKKLCTANKRSSLIFLIALISSFLFIYIYIYLADTIGNKEFLGKNLFTGRNIVWQEALSIIKDNLFFGYSNKYMFRELYTSAHNTLLAVLFIFGIVPTLLLILIMYLTHRTAVINRISQISTVAILCCVFIMCVETLLTDSNTYYYFTTLFLLKGELKNDT